MKNRMRRRLLNGERKIQKLKIRLNHVVVIQIFREIELVLPERENVKLMNANNCV